MGAIFLYKTLVQKGRYYLPKHLIIKNLLKKKKKINVFLKRKQRLKIVRIDRKQRKTAIDKHSPIVK
ncbi:hypothetical protein DTQ70_24545 [Runella sp. SP2]|nr:hypothetical protein DTQ70_24545 [Runella sp. SP2]